MFEPKIRVRDFLGGFSVEIRGAGRFRHPRVAQLQRPAPGMAHDLARPAAVPPAQGLDAQRFIARIQHLSHQREQVAGAHAQRGMQRVGSEAAARGMRRAEAAAKLADAVLRVLAPSVASVDHRGVAPPAEAGRQRPAGEAALRQRVAALRAVELLLAGLPHPPHHHRERLGRAAHRAQESSRRARRTLTLFGRARSHWRMNLKLREFGAAEPPRNSAAAMPVSAMRPTIGMQPLSFLYVNCADDFSQRRGRVDIQGRPFPMVQRDRQRPADAEQLHQRPLLAKLLHPAQMPRALVHHQHERDEIRARAESARLLPGSGRSKQASSPSLRISSASAARPLREANLSFATEILQDWMSIKPCSVQARPAGEMFLDAETRIMQGFIPFCSFPNAILRLKAWC